MRGGLCYADPSDPGIRRLRAGRGFTYRHANGRPVGKTHRERIESLVIPPAWQEVWICPDPKGHIQAVGLDEDGRRQYLYHPNWRQVRDADKFDRLSAFGRALPDLRNVVRADLATPGLSRDKVVAAVVRVMEQTFVRVGSERYVRRNGTFGVATLEGRHVVEDRGDRLVLRFNGKGGKQVEAAVRDARVARVVHACEELPGQRLFAFEDASGDVHPVTSTDINRYLKEHAGEDFTAKDLRTWGATTLMTGYLVESERQEAASDEKARRKVVREAVCHVAEHLGNTEAVCKKSYLHPAIPARYLEGGILEEVRQARPVDGLWPEETWTLQILDPLEP